VLNALRWTFALTAGLPFAAAAVENFPAAVVKYLNRQGPIIETRAYHAISPEQFIVYFCVDDARQGGSNEGANNASFTHCSVSLFAKADDGRWVYRDAVGIGQGTVKQFDDGFVEVESVKYAAGDALCCPSIKRAAKYATDSGKFVRVKE